MAGYQYGTPSPVRTVQPNEDRPRCWGKSYEETDRECRGCGFQSSCKDEVFRKRTQPQSPTYFSPQPQPTRPYAFSQPAPFQQLAPQPFRQPVPSQLPAVARAIAPMMEVAQYQYQQGQPTHRYGWLQDPLYQMIHSAPPPMRHQMVGESFFGRALKNVLLVMIEKGIAECFLAIRQMIFAPEPVPMPQPIPHPVPLQSRNP